jgi:hypothetical protein
MRMSRRETCRRGSGPLCKRLADHRPAIDLCKLHRRFYRDSGSLAIRLLTTAGEAQFHSPRYRIAGLRATNCLAAQGSRARAGRKSADRRAAGELVF